MHISSDSESLQHENLLSSVSFLRLPLYFSLLKQHKVINKFPPLNHCNIFSETGEHSPSVCRVNRTFAQKKYKKHEAMAASASRSFYSLTVNSLYIKYIQSTISFLLFIYLFAYIQNYTYYRFIMFRLSIERRLLGKFHVDRFKTQALVRLELNRRTEKRLCF